MRRIRRKPRQNERRQRELNQPQATAPAAAPYIPPPPVVVPVPTSGGLDNQKTRGAVNGRFWNSFTDGHQVLFVVGYCTGLQRWANETLFEKDSDCGQSTHGEIQEGLTNFFRVPENRAVAIGDAVWIFHLNIGGVVSADFAPNQTSVTVGGDYRYFFGSERSRIRPFVGMGVGETIITSSGVGVNYFTVPAAAGIRVFIAPHVAVDLSYGFTWTHVPGASFQQSSTSNILVGFAHVF